MLALSAILFFLLILQGHLCARNKSKINKLSIFYPSTKKQFSTINKPELLAITGLSPNEDVGRLSFLESLLVDVPPTSKESSKLETEGMDDRPWNLIGDLRPGGSFVLWIEEQDAAAPGSRTPESDGYVGKAGSGFLDVGPFLSSAWISFDGGDKRDVCIGALLDNSCLLVFYDNKSVQRWMIIIHVEVVKVLNMYMYMYMPRVRGQTTCPSLHCFL